MLTWQSEPKEGNYPLMSYAVMCGLYHPRCKDVHTTYFPGISTADDTWTEKELEDIGLKAKEEAKQQYAKRLADKFDRMAKNSLDKDNKRMYQGRVEQWKKSFADGGSKDRLSLLSDADSESELGAFKKKIIGDKGMEKAYYNTLKDKFSHGSDDAKRVFNKYVPNDSVVNYAYEGTAKYENGKIYMHYGADLNNPRGAGATWYHEHGHMIDELAGNASNDTKFAHALYKDFLDNILEKSYSEIEKELIDMRTQSAVSDIFNGLSKDEIKGVATHPLRLDGSSYWTDESVKQEAFAHMFECQFDDLRYVEMKKYFPNALTEFERILKGL